MTAEGRARKILARQASLRQSFLQNTVPSTEPSTRDIFLLMLNMAATSKHTHRHAQINLIPYIFAH